VIQVLKKVIALKGKANVGKSQTIKTVTELLQTKYPHVKIDHHHSTRGDVRVVLTFDGQRIGIESQGDPNRRLIKESLDLFVSVGCEVIICATRTSGATVNAVNALEEHDVLWLDQPMKAEPWEQVLSNLAMARKIVEETEKVIDSAHQPAVLSYAAGR
jgi:hypothetical protein